LSNIVLTPKFRKAGLTDCEELMENLGRERSTVRAMGSRAISDTLAGLNLLSTSSSPNLLAGRTNTTACFSSTAKRTHQAPEFTSKLAGRVATWCIIHTGTGFALLLGENHCGLVWLEVKADAQTPLKYAAFARIRRVSGEIAAATCHEALTSFLV